MSSRPPSGLVACVLIAGFTIQDSGFAGIARPTQSAPLALSADDALLINTNPEAGTITAFDTTATVPVKAWSLKVGNEPVSVAIDPAGDRAFVALALDAKIAVVDIGTRKVFKRLNVGKEPSALVLSPNGTRLYVANAASNSVMVFDAVPAKPTLLAVVDVSASGTHPSALAVTNDGDTDDTDETVFVALFYGQLRTGKSGADEGQDDQKEGRVVAIDASTNGVLIAPNPITLAPLADTGFNSNGRLAPATNQTPSVAAVNPQVFNTATAAYPNQLASLGLQPGAARAYVVSTGASPNGPLRFNSMAQGLVSVFDTATRLEITAAQTDPTVRATAPLNLNQGVNLATAPTPRFFFTNPVGIAWRPDGTDAWIAVQQSDCVVRITTLGAGTPTIGAPLIAAAGSIVRVDLQSVVTGEIAGKAPRGLVTNSFGDRLYVSNRVSRSVTVIDITDGAAPVIVATVASTKTAKPGSAAAELALGEELFYTGRGPDDRMSSEAWGGCIVCHPNGRSDNVTWMFDAGPRQTIPLDGMFGGKGQSNQRILNWSGVRDENQDFELNTRGVFGGRGLIDDDRLLLAIGGASGVTPTDSTSIEQYHQFTNTAGTTNSLKADDALPALLAGRRDFAIATLADDRVIVIGGRNGAGDGTLLTGDGAVVEFDPHKNKLRVRSETGFTPRHSLGAVAVQTPNGPRVYAIGGWASTTPTSAPVNTVQEYDPVLDLWRTVAPLNVAVAQFAIAVAGGHNTTEPAQLVHVISGNTGSETVPSVVNATPVQRYTPDNAGNGAWTATLVAGLTLRRNHGAAAVLRGTTSRIFVIGGQNGAGTVINTVEEYQAQALTFQASTHTALPTPRARFGIAGTTSSNQIYVVGGVDSANVEQSTIFEYTPATQGGVAGPAGTPSGAWVTKNPLATARRSLQVSSPPGVTNFLMAKNSGRDPRQDAITRWVAERIRPADAPVASTDLAALAGKTLFQQPDLVVVGFSCASCHGGAKWTRSIVDFEFPPSPESAIGLGNERVIGAELRETLKQGAAVLNNVGTFLLTGRKNELRSNAADVAQAIAPLGANGFNIPSLLSVHETAPYFYSGLAPTLEAVLNGSVDGNGGVRHHFVTDAGQRANLIAFLRSIDAETKPFK